jgi:hypothetical protein
VYGSRADDRNMQLSSNGPESGLSHLESRSIRPGFRQEGRAEFREKIAPVAFGKGMEFRQDPAPENFRGTHV